MVPSRQFMLEGNSTNMKTENPIIMYVQRLLATAQTVIQYQTNVINVRLSLATKLPYLKSKSHIKERKAPSMLLCIREF